MAHRTILKNLEYFDPRQRRFQSACLQIRWVIWHDVRELRLSALSYSVLAPLLNQLKLSMHMLFTRPVRLSAIIGMFGILSATFLTGCATKPATPPTTADNTTISTQGVQKIEEGRFLGILSPYRIDCQQGNFVSSETMVQLRDGMKRKEGMTRDQVRFLLGTPLITDAFHGDRWDYVFRLQRNNGEVLTSKVTVFFSGNQLSKVDGTILPTEKDYIALIAGNAAAKK
jgi:outer membrane protein assembly factor BamE